MGALLGVTGTAAVAALLTAMLGWWILPVVALVSGWLVPPGRRPVAVAVAGVVVGWGLLLLRAATAPRFDTLVELLRGVTGQSAGVLVILTLAIAGGLGLGGGLVGAALRRERRP
ncbi:MAG: hypothetical protein AB7L66_01820 [Gemmatimonadales bacterium]